MPPGNQDRRSVPAELAGLRAAVRPVYRALESNPTTRLLINEITAMRQAAGGAPGTVTCPAGSTGGTAATASALKGTWQVTFTEAELAAAGAGAAGVGVPSEGNWGHFIFTLRHGHWWYRLAGGDPGVSPNNKLDFGTYVTAGDKISFYRHDHDYSSSDTEIWGPYIWSVYRDTLTFKTAGWSGGFQGPMSLVVKPWDKTGA